MSTHLITPEPEIARDSFEQFLHSHLSQQMLRFTTAGSVDDGKSTLIGRLLHDTKSVYEDQLAAIASSRVNRASGGRVDLSLLTDGLKAEREQGITIDVAYRYFSTSKRKFIIADTPGHEQYTRNMATGASTADVAVVLIDARAFLRLGTLLPQSRRHTTIASLLGIPHLVAAVNKMDLVGFSEDAFRTIEREFRALTTRLGLRSVTLIPVSALEGDNVVSRSLRTPWYPGPTLLEYLETVPLAAAANDDAPLRFPVQLVQRPDLNFRGFSGQVARGVLRPGDEVMALPSRKVSTVKRIVTWDGDLPAAIYPQAVTVELHDEIDLSRGEMLVPAGDPSAEPYVSTALRAMVVWMHEEPLTPGRGYLAKHTTRVARAAVRRIVSRLDIGTLDPIAASSLSLNEVAEIELDTSLPLFFDPYEVSRTTGSLILIDPISNASVGAAMILGPLPSVQEMASPATRSSADVERGPEELAERLLELVQRSMLSLESLSPEKATVPIAPGKWSTQQTIGHLCDSAFNHQQRVVRLQLQSELHLPDYAQDEWLRVQRYDLLPWLEVVNLWVTLNRHLAHIIRHSDPSAFVHSLYIGEHAENLRGLLDDYITHLERHLRSCGLEPER